MLLKRNSKNMQNSFVQKSSDNEVSPGPIQMVNIADPNHKSPQQRIRERR